MHAALIKRLALVLCAMLTCSCLHAQVEDFVNTSFSEADSIAQLYPNHSLLDLKLLSRKLTHSLTTDEEKFRAIYKWVCHNIDNDYSLYRENKRKREKLKDARALEKWNKAFGVVVFRTLLKKHKTVCTGYAYLIKELAHHAGLSCEVIHGYGRTAQANVGGPGIANHSWNAVRLRNKWYLCDATWSSGAIDTERAMFVKNYNDAYFLPGPSLFVRNHYPLDTAWMLLHTKPTRHEFLNRPLIYSPVIRYQISQLLPDSFNITAAKKDTVSFQFVKNSTLAIEKVELLIKGAGKDYAVHPSLSRYQNGFYHVGHKFPWKGTYIVHVLLNDLFAFTYTVKITD